MRRNLRGKEYVDPQVQGALWRRLVLHWITFTAVAAALVVGMEWMTDPFRSTGEILVSAWWTYGPVLVVLIALIPVFVYDSIRVSHRFAGPVFRLRQVISKLANGGIPDRIEFRDGDFWKEMATDINRVIDRLGDGKPSTKEANP